MNEKFKKWIESKYIQMYQKSLKSRWIFYGLSILSLSLTAIMIILNLYAIKKNPLENTKILFVIISVLTGFIGLMTSIIAFFNLRNNVSNYQTKSIAIKKEYSKWKQSIDEYDIKEKDELLIDVVLKIVDE